MRHPAPFTARAVRLPVLTVCLAMLIALASPWLAAGQEAGDGTPSPVESEVAIEQPAAPSEETAPAATEVATEAPTAPVEPVTEPPGETPATESAPPATPDTPATESPTSTVEEPPPPHLIYESAPEMTCRPAETYADGVIAAGAIFDYDCTLDLIIGAERLPPDDIRIDWSVSARTEESWSVQISSPWIDDGNWSEPGLALVELHLWSTAPDALRTEDADRLAGTVTLPFGIRLYRPACAADLPLIEVAAQIAASVPANERAIVTQEGAHPSPAQLAPLLAAIPDIAPTVSIESVTVEPVPFSLTEQTTYGSIAIRVDNPVVQCRSWTVQIDVATFAGSTPVGVTNVTAAGAIENATGDGYAQFVLDPALGMSQSTSVSTVQAGAAPGSFTQTIEFAVILPGQLSAGALIVHATASVMP